MKNRQVSNGGTLIRVAKPAALLLVMCGICVLASAAANENENVEQIDLTKTALKEWIANQRIISQEKRDLSLAKEMLGERIALVKREISTLQERISDANESIAEADKKREEMLAENEKLKKASAALEGVVLKLEGGVRALLKRLPDPIRQRVKPLSQRLPEDPNEVKLSTGERFQNVVGILNEVDKFNREVSVTSEVRSLPDGSSIEVTALYVGLGQAYYVSANEAVAGVGTVTPDGWKWRQHNEAAPQIAAAIAILKNEKVASFVQLPAKVK